MKSPNYFTGGLSASSRIRALPHVRLTRAFSLVVLSSLCLVAFSYGDPGPGSVAWSTSASTGNNNFSISPQKAILEPGSTLQFHLTATENVNSATEWFVNGVVGGNSSSGTISASGLYTAPQAVNSNTAILIAARKSGFPSPDNAIVTIVPRPARLLVHISPTSAKLAPGEFQQFAGMVTGTANRAIAWVVNGQPGGNSSVGTISSTGLYTAPATVSSPTSFRITAMSQYDPAASATAMVTITPSPARPTHNVQTFGATVNSDRDATAAINNATSTCPAQGCTVYFPAGVYALKSPSTPIVINQPNINFSCDPGAIIQAQTGFVSPDWPELEIRGSASDVTVHGCIFDGNSISGRGVQVDATAARIYLDHIESKNQTGSAVQGALRTGGLLQITNSYFHHNLGGLYDSAGSGGRPTLRVDSNRFDYLSGIAIGSSGDNYFEASSNVITNDSVTQGALYCYGCDQVDWQHNSFSEDGAALHCDTCGGGTISFNNATNDNAVGFPDFFVEVGSNFTIEGNTSTNKSGERGMVVGVGSTSQGPASLRTQVFSFDSTTGFTAGSHVKLTTDADDHQEGSASMLATADTGFTTGTLWFSNFAGPQSFWQPYQDIWIKPVSGPLNAGQIQLVCSVTADLSTHDLVVAIPQLTQTAWYRLTQYATGWEGALAINGQSTSGFRSCGVAVTTNSPGLAIKFDDFDNAVEELNHVVKSNTIVNANSTCIGFGALQGGVIEGNDCEGVVGGAMAGYVDENSNAITFLNNKSRFSTPATHLMVDAKISPATVSAFNDDTNATTKYLEVNGGKVVVGP